MKKDIHPEYKETTVRCVCGNEFKTRSTLEEISVEICSNCHPFFTGQQKLIDSAGRVERFMRKYGLKPGEASDTAMKTGGGGENAEETKESAGEATKDTAKAENADASKAGSPDSSKEDAPKKDEK